MLTLTNHFATDYCTAGPHVAVLSTHLAQFLRQDLTIECPCIDLDSQEIRRVEK